MWGVYHGGWLLLERRFGWRNVDAIGAQAARRAATFLIVLIGWVIFRADSLGAAGDFLVAMVSFDDLGLGSLARATSTRAVVTLIAATAVVLLPRHTVTGPMLVADTGRRARLVRTSILGVGLPFALLLAASGAFSPFLYFQF